MTFIDWFAGIGGFRRGLELSGHKCVGFCEFDKYAVMSYTSMHLITEEQRECFRLQGWEDKYFDRAEFVNSDSQLYKQAGNGVTVTVIQAIGERLHEKE